MNEENTYVPREVSAGTEHDWVQDRCHRCGAWATDLNLTRTCSRELERARTIARMDSVRPGTRDARIVQAQEEVARLGAAIDAEYERERVVSELGGRVPDVDARVHHLYRQKLAVEDELAVLVGLNARADS